MPLTEQQIKALKTDAIVNLGKTELFDKDISIIIKVLTGSEKIAKLTLPGNQLYKDYQLLINAILQHSTLLVVEFANPANIKNVKFLSEKTPAAVNERVLLVCLEYKREIYELVAKAKKVVEQLTIELSKDIFSSRRVATLALNLRHIHKEIEKIQQREYFVKFFSEKFNTDIGKFSYSFPLPEINNLFNQMKIFENDNFKDRNFLKKTFLDKLGNCCSEMRELDLSGWDFTHQDFTGLAKMFFSSADLLNKLRRLTLTHFSFSQDSTKFLCLIVKKCSLESIDISNNLNFDAYQEKFFNIVVHNKNITKLDVRGTLSVEATKILLKKLIQLKSSVKVVELTKDRRDSEQKTLLKHLKNNARNRPISVQNDFSESKEYFKRVINSLKAPHKGATLSNLESKLERFGTDPNSEDEKKLYIGIMEFLMALDKPILDLLISHFTALCEYCLSKVNHESKLDGKLNYLELARMYIDRIFSEYDIPEDFYEPVKPLAFEVCKKLLLMYIKQQAKICDLSEKDISFIKDHVEDAQAMSALQGNLNTLLLMAEQHSELKQNMIFRKIELVYSNTCFFEKKPVTATENKTSIAYILKGSIWGKVNKLSNAVQGFLSSVTEKDKIPDDKSPAP